MKMDFLKGNPLDEEELLKSAEKVLDSYNKSLEEILQLEEKKYLCDEQIIDYYRQLHKKTPENLKTFKEGSVSKEDLFRELCCYNSYINRNNKKSFEIMKAIETAFTKSKMQVSQLIRTIDGVILDYKNEKTSITKDSIRNITNLKYALEKKYDEILQKEEVNSRMLLNNKCSALPELAIGAVSPYKLSHAGRNLYLPQSYKSYISLKGHYHSFSNSYNNEDELMDSLKKFFKTECKLYTKENFKTFLNNYAALDESIFQRLIENSVTHLKAQQLQEKLYNDYSQKCCFIPRSKVTKTILKEMMDDVSKIIHALDKDITVFTEKKEEMENIRDRIIEKFESYKKLERNENSPYFSKGSRSLAI